nr:MAG TPA: hypothetical protein [Bacteriophage sp.]
MQALTRYPFRVSRHSLQNGLEPKRKPSARPCRLICFKKTKLYFFNAPPISSKCSLIRLRLAVVLGNNG